MIRKLGQPGSANFGMAGGRKVYNNAVPSAGQNRQPEPPPAQHHRTPQVYTLEATGLLVIAVLVLILTLVRYWHHIAWSAR